MRSYLNDIGVSEGEGERGIKGIKGHTREKGGGKRGGYTQEKKEEEEEGHTRQKGEGVTCTLQERRESTSPLLRRQLPGPSSISTFSLVSLSCQ